MLSVNSGTHNGAERAAHRAQQEERRTLHVSALRERDSNSNLSLKGHQKCAWADTGTRQDYTLVTVQWKIWYRVPDPGFLRVCSWGLKHEVARKGGRPADLRPINHLEGRAGRSVGRTQSSSEGALSASSSREGNGGCWGWRGRQGLSWILGSPWKAGGYSLSVLTPDRSGWGWEA